MMMSAHLKRVLLIHRYMEKCTAEKWHGTQQLRFGSGDFQVPAVNFPGCIHSLFFHNNTLGNLIETWGGKRRYLMHKFSGKFPPSPHLHPTRKNFVTKVQRLAHHAPYRHVSKKAFYHRSITAWLSRNLPEEVRSWKTELEADVEINVRPTFLFIFCAKTSPSNDEWFRWPPVLMNMRLIKVCK